MFLRQSRTFCYRANGSMWTFLCSLHSKAISHILHGWRICCDLNPQLCDASEAPRCPLFLHGDSRSLLLVPASSRTSLN